MLACSYHITMTLRWLVIHLNADDVSEWLVNYVSSDDVNHVTFK